MEDSAIKNNNKAALLITLTGCLEELTHEIRLVAEQMNAMIASGTAVTEEDWLSARNNFEEKLAELVITTDFVSWSAKLSEDPKFANKECELIEEKSNESE